MTHKLVPLQNNPYLSPGHVVRRLRDEFQVVEADVEEGRDHVQSMLLQFIKMKQGGMLGCDTHIDRLQKVREEAVAILVADDASDENTTLRFVVVPEEPIFIGYYSQRHQDQAKLLLERCAHALGYQIAWA